MEVESHTISIHTSCRYVFYLASVARVAPYYDEYWLIIIEKLLLVSGTDWTRGLLIELNHTSTQLNVLERTHVLFTAFSTLQYTPLHNQTTVF